MMTSVILIVVIAALCFSAGEGLRLTPFPVSAPIGETSDTLLAKPAEQISNHKYGPLDVPTQHQKRNQRQAVSLDFLPTENSCAIANALHPSASHELSKPLSVLVVSKSAGRAPPFAS
jgi:hypothetical protein